MNGQRRTTIVRVDPCPHPLQRIDHAAHRTLAERGVTGHHAGKRLRRQHALNMRMVEPLFPQSSSRAGTDNWPPTPSTST